MSAPVIIRRRLTVTEAGPLRILEALRLPGPGAEDRFRVYLSAASDPALIGGAPGRGVAAVGTRAGLG
ncbi:MAG: hypothetical protein D6832_05730, partial [Alphaproteobacteria bacterium]